jgi:FixJ family two-component response regulator
VFVTAHGDVPLAVDAMRRGAAHFIEKPFSAETLVQAVRTAAGRPVGDQRPPDADSKLARLSPRERQVLDLVLTGKLNKTIADILGISVKTVNNTHQLLRLVLSPG